MKLGLLLLWLWRWLLLFLCAVVAHSMTNCKFLLRVPLRFLCIFCRSNSNTNSNTNSNLNISNKISFLTFLCVTEIVYHKTFLSILSWYVTFVVRLFCGAIHNSHISVVVVVVVLHFYATPAAVDDILWGTKLPHASCGTFKAWKIRCPVLTWKSSRPARLTPTNTFQR